MVKYLQWIRNNLTPLALWCWLEVWAVWAQDEKERLRVEKQASADAERLSADPEDQAEMRAIREDLHGKTLNTLKWDTDSGRFVPHKTMCQLCFTDTSYNDLLPVSEEAGMRWDVCKWCAEEDAKDGGTF